MTAVKYELLSSLGFTDPLRHRDQADAAAAAVYVATGRRAHSEPGGEIDDNTREWIVHFDDGHDGAPHVIWPQFHPGRAGGTTYARITVRTDKDGAVFIAGADAVRYYHGCASCDSARATKSTFFPPHRASSRCESGRRNHCTCDACF